MGTIVLEEHTATIIIIIIIWHYNSLWVFAFSAKSLPSSSILSCLFPVFDFQLF
jgi:hypothetical protein